MVNHPLRNPERVVHVIYAGLGGHGAVLFSLLESGFLVSSKNSVLFVGVEMPRDEYIDRCESLGVGYSYVSRADNSFFSFAKKVSDHLRREAPDCVFLHGLSAVPGALLYKSGAHRTALVLRETQAYHLKTWKEWVLLSLAGVFFNRIIYLTSEAEEATRRRLGVFFRSHKSCVIGNGLNLGLFANNYRLALPNVKIGMQSRFQSNKDHVTLLRAFKLVVTHCPGCEFSLYLAGDGETLPAVRRLAADLDISHQVHFLGLLKQSELVEFLRSLTIYVHSTYGETMSTAIMQALSSGLPVLAANVPGVANMIDGSNGLLFPLKDADSLAKMIVDLIDNPDVLIGLSGRARRYAEANFDSALVQKKYELCISKVMREVSGA